jgi:hypothetical protein
VTPRRRGEEGQVYPALLIAVIGGFALAVGFVALQLGIDQTGRSDSASDAAALAVGREHRDDFVDIFAGNNGLHLGQLRSLLEGSGPVPGANDAAQDFAHANGADLVGDVVYRGFEADRMRWVYEVTTRQQDTVESGESELRSESTSRVAVEVTRGICPGFAGIEYDRGCITPAEYVTGCVEPPPPPEPPPLPEPTRSPRPTESPRPSPSPSPTPTPFEPADFCELDLAELLEWNIRLIA